MSKKQKKMLTRIIIAAVMLIALRFIPVTGLLRLALYLVVYIIIGYDILRPERAYLTAAYSTRTS